MMQKLAVTLSPRSISISQIAGVLVEGRGDDAGVEHDLVAQIEAVGDVVGVGENFGLRRIFLDQLPVLVELLENKNDYCMLSTSQRAPG